MDSIHDQKSGSPESLAARAFAGFRRVAMLGRNTALTTGMTTDRKIFDFRPRRGIMAKTEHPGVAELVPRHIWDMVGNRSNQLLQNPQTLANQGFAGWDFIPTPHFLSFDHLFDHN